MISNSAWAILNRSGDNLMRFYSERPAFYSDMASVQTDAHMRACRDDAVAYIHPVTGFNPMTYGPAVAAYEPAGGKNTVVWDGTMSKRHCWIFNGYIRGIAA